MEYLEAQMIYDNVFEKAYSWLKGVRSAKRRSVAAWAGVWAGYHHLHGFTPSNPLLAWQLACAFEATRHFRPWGRGLVNDARHGWRLAARWRAIGLTGHGTPDDAQ